MSEQCQSHQKPLILCEDCRSQIDAEAEQKHTFVRHTAFDDAKKDVTALLLSTIEELKLRPEEGGPYYFIPFGSKCPERVAIHPSQMTPVFDAIFRRMGGWVDLEKWQREIAQGSYEEGFGRGLGVARRLVEDLYEESHLQENHRTMLVEALKEAAK